RVLDGQTTDEDRTRMINALGRALPGGDDKVAELGRTEVVKAGANGSKLEDEGLNLFNQIENSPDSAIEAYSGKIDEYAQSVEDIPQKVAREMCKGFGPCDALFTKYEQLEKLYGRIQKVVEVLPGAVAKAWNDW